MVTRAAQLHDSTLEVAAAGDGTCRLEWRFPLIALAPAGQA
jgi:hypothetical protein